MLPHTLSAIPLRYCHIHPLLYILLRLLRQLTLVSDVLCVLESSCHPHDLSGLRIWFFALVIVIASTVANGLELRTVVDCGDLDWAGNHLGRLVYWAVLGGAGWFISYLTAVGVGSVHFLLDLGVVLVL
jgi:hypothetical protein